MKKYFEKYKISTNIVLIALVLFFIFYFFINKKIALKSDPIPPEAQEPQSIQVMSLKNNFQLKDLRGRLGSFTESFSGTGWKDLEKTSVYHDLNSLNMSLPIKYILDPISTTTFPVEPKDLSQVCIKDRCIFLKDGMIYKKNKTCSVPECASQEKLIDFEVEAIGKAGSFWLLATIEEKDKKDKVNGESREGGLGHLKIGEKKVKAVIYAYDGKNYRKLIGEEFLKSDFGGKFLLGGTDLEFIAGFYGFGSKILKFKRNAECTNNLISFFKYYKIIDHLTACYQAQDISHWFSSRMAGIRGVNFFKNGNIYIFHSNQAPFFAVANNDFLLDLTETLRLDQFQNVIVESQEGKIVLSTSNNDERKLFEFVFQGFDKSKPVSWVSSNLTKKTIKGAAIVSYVGHKDGGDIKFYFSVNGEDWEEAEPGENVYFSERNEEPEFYWRADLVPQEDDPTTSPFLSQVNMSYVK